MRQLPCSTLHCHASFAGVSPTKNRHRNETQRRDKPLDALLDPNHHTPTPNNETGAVGVATLANQTGPEPVRPSPSKSGLRRQGGGQVRPPPIATCAGHGTGVARRTLHASLISCAIPRYDRDADSVEYEPQHRASTSTMPSAASFAWARGWDVCQSLDGGRCWTHHPMARRAGCHLLHNSGTGKPPHPLNIPPPLTVPPPGAPVLPLGRTAALGVQTPSGSLQER